VPQRPAAANNIGQAADADNNNRAERNNNNIPQHPLLNVRDRLFHALFYRMATVYARAVPMPLRTAIECGALFMVGILLLCLLSIVKCIVIYMNFVMLYVIRYVIVAAVELLYQVPSKRLAEKSVSEMTYFVSLE